MDPSNKFTELIAKLEGVETHQYLDSRGLPTIGIGHLLSKSELSSGKIWINGNIVYYKNGLSNPQIYQLLIQDAKTASKAVNTFVKVPLTQNQFDALTSFCFNIGNTAFKNSTLVKELNAKRYENVPSQMRRWKYAGNEISQGLINRREQEIALFLEEANG